MVDFDAMRKRDKTPCAECGHAYLVHAFHFSMVDAEITRRKCETANCLCERFVKGESA